MCNNSTGFCVEKRILRLWKSLKETGDRDFVEKIPFLEELELNKL